MFKLENISEVLSGLPAGDGNGEARFVRLADLSCMVAGAPLALGQGVPPLVARAVPIRSSDIIIAARGGAALVGVATEEVIGAYISLDLYLIRPDQTRVDPDYLCAVLKLPSTQAVFSGARQGSNLQRLPKEALETLQIPLPPLSRQKAIAALSSAFADEAHILAQLQDRHALLAREKLQIAIAANQQNTKSDRIQK